MPKNVINLKKKIKQSPSLLAKGDYLSTWTEEEKTKKSLTAIFFLQQDDVSSMKAQMREQTRTIADLKESLMVSDLVAVNKSS